MNDRPWRGPAELDAPQGLSPEFPEGADAPPEITRRGLLQLLGASASLATGAGCSRGPSEDIVPYVDQPPGITPSVPTFYATAMTLGGLGTGMLVESHEGRPTKAEGNPAHPASMGGLGVLEQASVLSLYDPTRASMVTRDGVPATWDEFAATIAASTDPGRRIHILMEPTSAPHVVDLVARVRQRADVAVHFDAPLSRAQAYRGARLAFGQVVEPRCNFVGADVVLSLDSDFLAVTLQPAAWAREWAKRRRLERPDDTMSRLYVVEARLSVTGMAADERLRAQAREVRGIASAILSEIVVATTPSAAGAAAAGSPARSIARDAAAERSTRGGPHGPWIRAVARDLIAHRGSSLVLAGDGQPPEVHALAHAMNEALDNVGSTVTYAPSPIYEAGEDSHGLEPLVSAIDAGRVSSLIVIGGNPVYTAPADLDLARRVRSVKTSAYVGSHDNETARSCSFCVPEAHFLESWSDVRAFDGTATIVQPLVRPLHDGKTAAQVLAALLGQPRATTRELVDTYWRAHALGDFGEFRQRALVRGLVGGVGTAPPFDTHVDWAAIARELATPDVPRVPLEIVYFADSKVYDGRFADNAWLQELADPVTKLTWDNAALMSPATAERMKLRTSNVVDIDVRGRSVRAPVFVVPGMAEDVVAIALGYGQKSDPGRVSHDVGANAYLVRDTHAPWFDEARLQRAPGSWRLALTQEHWSMEGRPIVLRRSLADYRRNPGFGAPENTTPRRLYFLRPDARHQWGMTIDLNTCTGCSACVVACMAENNIPVVGKLGVANSREMHWIRIDRYFIGPADNPAVVVQPMLCQHCEAAPCEYVCPVNATVHSPDGLNEMIYNRCVGTRFCSNNCPYKVRRFNFFNYNVNKPETLQLAMNPEVTVRARGVMEKCSYCVQRIREVEVRARREERPIHDGEIQTACQQTCPTGAIVFGDIADPMTQVARTRNDPRLYQVLHDLGTLPRTRYLARIVNPNPELAHAANPNPSLAGT